MIRARDFFLSNEKLNEENESNSVKNQKYNFVSCWEQWRVLSRNVSFSFNLWFTGFWFLDFWLNVSLRMKNNRKICLEKFASRFYSKLLSNSASQMFLYELAKVIWRFINTFDDIESGSTFLLKFLGFFFFSSSLSKELKSNFHENFFQLFSISFITIRNRISF